MIKIGIEGAGAAEAGELIRLLINHPDVKLDQICQPEYAGRPVTDIHHGLQGETRLVFCNRLDTDSLDVIFVSSSARESRPEDFENFIEEKAGGESGFVIWLCPSAAMLETCAPYYLRVNDTEEGDKPEGEDMEPGADDWSQCMVFGVPELNRKPLVRGAHRAVVPTAVESVTAIILQPFGRIATDFSSLTVNVETAAEIAAEIGGTVSDIERRLSRLASGIFGREVAVGLCVKAVDNTMRCMRVGISFPVETTAQEVKNLFLDLYDDHNMVHFSDKELDFREVEGTNNCLVGNGADSPGMISMEAIVDARLRGGAGEAVHVMNLFAGLFEKTGLNLKASKF